MSQAYFDTYVNKIGETAAALATVTNNNRINNEEINNWVEDFQSSTQLFLNLKPLLY